MRQIANDYVTFIAIVSTCMSACSSGEGSGNRIGSSEPTTTADVLGESHSGQYHLGPVDFSESSFHNACAPNDGYRSSLYETVGLGGEYLAGLSHQYIEGGAMCDACILVKTATGKSVVLRVVTYGDTNEPGDIDVSPSAYKAINTEEYPRTMTWEFARCPDSGGISYEFQTGANVWWTSFWVRNASLPLEKVEVKSANHSEFAELRRETNGTLNDDGGFGEGPFTIRLTATNGQTISHDFQSFSPGELVETSDQFD
jgi:hypothetical protein